MRTMNENRRLLKPSEVARRLGVTPRTVAKWLRDGDLKGIKINGWNWRVREEDLNAFIESRPTPP